jgi:hypothetical protein
MELQGEMFNNRFYQFPYMRVKAYLAVLLLSCFILLSLFPAVLALDPTVDYEGLVLDYVVAQEPQYRKTPEELIRQGDELKEKCDFWTDKEIQRTREVFQTHNVKMPSDSDLRNYTVRYYLQSYAEIRDDEDLTTARDIARIYCEKAEKSYSLALQKLDDNDFNGQAVVWDHAAGLFEAEGIYWAQETSENNAGAARTRAGIHSLFEPVPVWVVVAALLFAVAAFHCSRKKNN